MVIAMTFFSSGCLTLKVRAWQIFYLWPKSAISTFCPATETSHDYRSVSGRQPQLPRRPRRIPGARGYTALHVAARNGYAAVVQLLISAGATLDVVDSSGRGPGRVFGPFLGVALTR